MVLKYGLAQKAAARTLGVNLIVVRKAVASHNEGREIGRKGRPSKLSSEQDAELLTQVEKMITEHRSPSRRQLASEVRPIFCFLSATDPVL
jgi:transposase